MTKILKIDGDYKTDKYMLYNTYSNFGIYKEISPSGYNVNQSWLITNDNVTLLIHSFCNCCYLELEEFIDNYNDVGFFGVNAFLKNGIYIMHINGNVKI